MSLPQTFAGGALTALEFAWAFLGDVPCCMVRAKGDPELYLGETLNVLRIQEHDDGTWTAWYQDTNPELIESTNRLVELGAWH